MSGKPDQVTRAAEDFLKAVLEFDQAGERATTNELAERLGVSAPTVTLMSKRLAGLGLLERTPYRGVTLSKPGRLVALEVLRHHRLLERYLVDALGMPLHEVHVEAERLEHVLSDALEERIDAALGHPTHDPHGDPIPDRDLNLNLPPTDRRSLASLDPGERSAVTRVPDHDGELLRYLEAIDLVPGSTVEVLLQGPFGGPVTVRTADGQHALARELASAIAVA